MQILFVGGCERSGTSLVQKLLCLDPRIAGRGEFIYTGRIAELFAQMAAEHPAPWNGRLSDHFSPAELADAFRGLYSKLLGPLREAPQREAGHVIRWVAEKTPSNVYSFPALAALFPDARFLHVVRDGRDVLASHDDVRHRLAKADQLTAYTRTHFTLRYVANRWNRAAKAHAQAASDSAFSDRYLLLRYEDLVTEPQDSLARLGLFLNLELDPRTQRPELSPAADLGLPIDELWTTEEADRRGFAPERCGRWHRDLSLIRKVRANLAMAPGLSSLGYPVNSLTAVAARLPAQTGSARK